MYEPLSEAFSWCARMIFREIMLRKSYSDMFATSWAIPMGVCIVCKVGFLKIGNTGSALVTEFLLDGRAERDNIDLRIVGSGEKLNPMQSHLLPEN